MLEIVKNLFGGSRTVDPLALTSVQQAEAAAARMSAERASARAKIEAITKRREAALLELPDEEVEALDKDGDRQRLQLERLDRIEPLLVERLQQLRTEAKKRRWLDIRRRHHDQCAIVAKLQRAALDATEALRQIPMEAQAAGLHVEASTLPDPPRLLSRDLILAFETLVERQVAEAAAQPKQAAQPRAPAPRSAIEDEIAKEKRPAIRRALEQRAAYERAAAEKAARATITPEADGRVTVEFVEGGSGPLFVGARPGRPGDQQRVSPAQAAKWAGAGYARVVPGAPREATAQGEPPQSTRDPAPGLAATPSLPGGIELPPADVDGSVYMTTVRQGLPLPSGGRSGRAAEVHAVPLETGKAWLRSGAATIPTAADIARARQDAPTREPPVEAFPQPAAAAPEEENAEASK
jgi:hypothetical protein